MDRLSRPYFGGRQADQSALGELKYMGKELSEMTLEELWELFLTRKVMTSIQVLR